MLYHVKIMHTKQDTHGIFYPKVEIKDYNVMVGELFSSPVKIIWEHMITYKIRKIATGQGDGYITDCLIDYPYFKEQFSLINCNRFK